MEPIVTNLLRHADGSPRYYEPPRRLSGGGHSGPDDLLFLFLFWVAAYVSAWLAQKTRLSPLLFYLLFGAIFINCKIIEHTPFMNILAEVAITIVFFALGFEENVGHFLGGIRKAWGIASIGALVPFLCGFGCCSLFWPELGIKPALMCGLAVTATAVSLTMITLKSEGLAVSKAAIGIMTSAVLDDVAALCLVAIMVPIATGEAEPTVLGIGTILGKAVGFFGIVIFLNVIVFPHDLSSVPIFKHIPFVNSLGLHHILRFHGGEQAVLASLGVGLGVGLVAKVFGFHPAIGAYMAGLIIEERYFDLKPQLDLHDLPDDATEVPVDNIYHHVKDVLENAAFCWLGPIFFLHLGSQIEIQVDIIKNVVTETLTIFVCLFVGQIASASLAARYVPGGFTWNESIMIGFGMLGRAELFFVVLNICYIENQIFTTEVFYSLTFAAMLLNISVPITISLFKPYYVGEKVCSMCSSQTKLGETPSEGSIHGDGSMPVSSYGWLSRKARKSDRALQRRICNRETDGELTEQLMQSPDAQISKSSFAKDDLEAQAQGQALDSSGRNLNSGDLPRAMVSKESYGLRNTSTGSFPRRPGCGVKGCVRSVCIICKRIDAELALEVLQSQAMRLAYEDEGQDLAAMDHGRPSQAAKKQEIPRTVSNPEYVSNSAKPPPSQSMSPDDELPRHLSCASVSGAGGKGLAREVRQMIEKHDPDALTRKQSGKNLHARNVEKKPDPATGNLEGGRERGYSEVAI